MSHTHSWKWLPPRLTGRKVSERVAGEVARPCLPAVERLDDRVLLSAAPVAAAAVEVPPPTGDPTRILIGLLRGGTDLVKGELDALKITDGTSNIDGLKASFEMLKIDFLKIDQLVFDTGERFLKGELTDKKLAQVEQKVRDAFLKIDDLVPTFDAGVQEALLPAVQKVREAAAAFVGSLGDLTHPGGVNLSRDQLKIAVDFLKLDGLFYKIGADILNKFDLGGLKIDEPALNRLDDLFLKVGNLISSLDDEKLKAVLLPAVQAVEQEALTYLKSLADFAGGGDFGGGAQLPDTGGDVIG